MTISTSGNRKSYNGDGVSTVFSFPYPFFDNGDIQVYLGGVLQSVGYTIAGAGSGAGTCTFAVAPPVGVANVLLVRNPSNLQNTGISANDKFPAKTVETMVDKCTLQIQRLLDLVGRSMKFSDGDSTSADPTLPTPVASSFIGWNALGTKLVNYAGLASAAVSSFMTPAVAATDKPTFLSAIGGLAPTDVPGVLTPGAITTSGLTMSTARVLGRTSASTGAVQELTGTQITAMLDAATTSLQGAIVLASSAEAIAGTNTAKAITPATLFAALNVTGTAPLYALRSWATYNGATPAMRGSGNVSSYTKNATGDFTHNFATSMPNVNYSFVCSGRRNNATAGPMVYSAGSAATYDKSTSSHRFLTYCVNAAAVEDPLDFNVMVTG